MMAEVDGLGEVRISPPDAREPFPKLPRHAQDIEQLCLGATSERSLKRAGYTTIGDMQDRPIKWDTLDGIGEKGAQKIVDILGSELTIESREDDTPTMLFVTDQTTDNYPNHNTVAFWALVNSADQIRSAVLMCEAYQPVKMVLTGEEAYLDQIREIAKERGIGVEL